MAIKEGGTLSKRDEVSPLTTDTDRARGSNDSVDLLNPLISSVDEEKALLTTPLIQKPKELDEVQAKVSLPEAGSLVDAPSNKKLLLPVEELWLSVRSANCLQRTGIKNVGELAQKTETDLLRIPNFGRKSLEVGVLNQGTSLATVRIAIGHEPPKVLEVNRGQYVSHRAECVATLDLKYITVTVEAKRPEGKFQPVKGGTRQVPVIVTLRKDKVEFGGALDAFDNLDDDME